MKFCISFAPLQVLTTGKLQNFVAIYIYFLIRLNNHFHTEVPRISIKRNLVAILSSFANPCNLKKLEAPELMEFS